MTRSCHVDFFEFEVAKHIFSKNRNIHFFPTPKGEKMTLLVLNDRYMAVTDGYMTVTPQIHSSLRYSGILGGRSSIINTHPPSSDPPLLAGISRNQSCVALSA